MDLAILKSRYGKKVGMKGGRMCTEMEDWVFDRDEMIGCWGGEMSRFLKGSVWSSGVSGRERVTVGGGENGVASEERVTTSLHNIIN